MPHNFVYGPQERSYIDECPGLSAVMSTYRPRGSLYIYIYIYIYNRPIGHYLDMHMETAGQNDIPGKIYIQLNVQL